ncbi:isoleucine--tRNA ligase [Candidatus Micrarchaeota archaeon]|nr:isoleucine--tRNA ligase [Candidatus Micrarchaeota archaeon]
MKSTPTIKTFTQYQPQELEAEIRAYWTANKTYQNMADRRKGRKTFYFLDGPPYVNASPHVGHVKTTTCKDIWTRLRYMQGFDAKMQAGFDCHGLPVEVMVEKELGVQSKQDIEKMGIDKFDALCLQKVENNEKIWMSIYQDIAALKGHFEPYFTYKPDYIQSAWWTLKQLHEKGLLVEGNKSIHWCPHCETALSGYEVSDSYKEVVDPSVYLKFKVKGATNEYLLVWTTTPWTLPSNVALAVAGAEQYIKVKVGDEFYILAEKRAEAVLKEICGITNYEIVDTFAGTKLDGLRYEPIIESEQQVQTSKDERAYRVYLSIPLMAKKKYKKHETSQKLEDEFQQFVTVDDGTGLVHCAPGHGQTDHFFGKHYRLPTLSPIDEKGCFTDQVVFLRGQFFKKANNTVTEKLKFQGSLLHAGQVKHSYPLCWRCKNPLVFRISRQWYLNIEPIKDKMVAANQAVHWMPEHGKEALNNWLADANDWCISQQRFWGIPMPIWQCGSCGRKKVIGSVDELKENATSDLNYKGALDDLHRHTVDGIHLKCECGKTMHRVKDIFNVWFDSSIAPWASLGYPFQNKEWFDQRLQEESGLADLVVESQDQVRGWFYVLLFTAMATFDKPAYKNISMMGWVTDEKGDKMSKSVGNVVWAQDALKQLGGDGMRLYYCWDIAPWDVQKFSFTSAKEVYKAMNIWFNALAFYESYKPEGFKAENGLDVKGKTDGKTATKYTLKSPEDAWLLSRLNTLTSEILQHYESFEFHHVGRKLVDFLVNDYSRWYIKLVRDRSAANDESARQCFSVMHHALRQMSLLFAPVTPFMSEYVWQKLGEKESVHHQDYPVAVVGAADAEMEATMSAAMAITDAGNAARKDADIKLRWPVQQVLVTGGADVEKAVVRLQKILMQSLNALNVTYYENAPEDARQMVKKDLSGFKDAHVYLDKSRDESLTNLCRFRELTRAIQSQRKAAKLNVKDLITLNIHVQDMAFKTFLEKNADALRDAVTAKRVEFASEKQAHEETVEDVPVSFSLKKA